MQSLYVLKHSVSYLCICSTPCLRSLTSALHCCRKSSNDFRALSEVLLFRMQHNRCIHQPGGHLFCRPHMRHAVLLIMLEWWLRGTRPPRSCSPMSHIYVLPWQLVRNKALKQQEACGISMSQTAQQGMHTPCPGPSIRFGGDGTQHDPR